MNNFRKTTIAKFCNVKDNFTAIYKAQVLSEFSWHISPFTEYFFEKLYSADSKDELT